MKMINHHSYTVTLLVTDEEPPCGNAVIKPFTFTYLLTYLLTLHTT